MCRAISLATYLDGWGSISAERAAVAKTVLAIAEGTRLIAELVALGRLEGELGAVVGANSQGDAQKALDVRANDLLMQALRASPASIVASEELDEPVELQGTGQIAVALDPLDGSSNIDANTAIGTIFSILPCADNSGARGSVFLQPGSRQKAAGYVIYGPQCALALTVGKGALIFTLDCKSGSFRLTGANVQIASTTREYAINASNERHWSPPVKAYVADCVAGRDGPRGEDYNMRWNASLVAECHRILSRGGVFLYPRDARKGYEQGRLRLVYEANPIAWLIEQAGGKATNGTERILDLIPAGLHQRKPLIFGSREEVDRIARYKSEPHVIGHRSPLFGERGLFRN
ncbi:MAG: class 1 fructose-bisphosphatase [Hyphomonadaceae bacterium]|nr:class 1 fructose-bisphosphatase [Hyphomonadaceae bacterium]